MEKAKHFKPRKHKRAPMGDQPSMANWRPAKGGFGFPKPAGVPKMPSAGAGLGIGRLQNSSMNGQSQPMKFKKMCKECGKKHAMGKHEKSKGKNDHDADDKKRKSRKKNWIAGAIKHPGALHRELGIKQGHKIPASRLRAAAKKGGTEGRRARLAETLKGFHHG